MLQTILSIVTIIIASVSLVLSIFIYKRQKTFENENQIFKYQLGKYHEILTIIRKIFPFIEGKIEELANEIQSSSPNNDKIEKIKDDLGFELEKIELEIFSNAAFVSENVFVKIDDFTQKLMQADFLENFSMKKYGSEYRKLHLLENSIFDIAEVMRDSLGIDPLNIKLQDRVLGTKRIEQKEKLQ